MKLTGKALEDFRTGIVDLINLKYDEKLIDKEGAVEWIEGANDLMLNAHIIEWFDSVGIYVELVREEGKFSYAIGMHFDTPSFDTRQEATEQAIIKANEIYNLRESKEDEKQLEGNI